MFFFVELFRVFVRLDDSKHVSGWIFGVSEPADFRDRHFRNANFSPALLDFLHRLLERFHRDGVDCSRTLSFARPGHSPVDSRILVAAGRNQPVFYWSAFKLLELPAEDVLVKRPHRFWIVSVNFKVSDAIHIDSFMFVFSILMWRLRPLARLRGPGEPVREPWRR